MALDFNTLLTGHFGEALLQGAIVTIELALSSWFLAILIALLLVIVRLTDHKTSSLIIGAYVSYHRNIPTLIQLMMWYFALPTLLPQSIQDWVNNQNAEFIFSVIALGLCQAAYFSEDIRSGLRAVPDGQVEASRALGMSYLWSLYLVIIPQGIRNSLPNVVNHTVQLFKNTSQAMVIGVADFTYVTRDIENQTFLTFESYLIATVGYLAFSLLLMGGGAMLGNYYQRAYAR
jgi:polar amino acid transport system permease protein